jgi:hypothetical protein
LLILTARGRLSTNPVFPRKNAVKRKGAAKSAALGQKMQENPDGDTDIAVASGQAVAGQEVEPATGAHTAATAAPITEAGTGTGSGATLADVLRAIASLSETDRELLLQLLQTLRGANT